ncbi:MAG: MMPL family transporter [Azoarcus sp.]|nr:MMPL family transporter [Azoarcus sp.]
MNNPEDGSSLGRNRSHRLLARLWLAFLLGIAGFLLTGWQSLAARVDTDLLALLPVDERRPALELALKALAAQGERQLALLVSTYDEAATRKAVAGVREALSGLGLTEQGSAAQFPGEVYFPYRHGLMNAADREWLATAQPEAATTRALNLAHAFFTPSNVPWRDDPYGLFGNWLQSLGEATPLRPLGGELMVEYDGRRYIALVYALPQSAFDADFQQKLLVRLDDARDRVHAIDPQAQLLRAGVVLHAAAIARQAENEMSLIGLGSLAGVFLLIGLVFQSARALKLLAVSLVSGALAALFIAFLLFERVHALTLVFGASLIGVAVDYAILVFAQHLGNEEPVWERYRKLLPTLGMVLITPALAYLALALTPFPGLKQMAVFAACGISGAWASVVLFYPYLLPASLPLPGNADSMTRLLARWPRWRNTGKSWALALCLAAAAAGGIAQLRANDDIRGLFNGESALMAEHRQVSEIMRLPSPAQMFLLDAETPEALLQSEETLIERLRPFIAAGKISGFEAVSRWLPSVEKQRQARALQDRLQASRAQLASKLELSAAWGRESASGEFLTPDAWFASPVSALFRSLWLGAVRGGDGASRYSSMVLLQGLAGRGAAIELAALAVREPVISGVKWIDQTNEISGLMARYRELLTKTLLFACLLVPFVLYPFFKSRVWRIVAPTLAAGGITLAVMGWLGIPLQLLSILALLLTLGMGVDYAIFLQARQTHEYTLLATTLAALLTLLSFGLLALSSTPALHALGLTVTLGVALSWLLTPVFLRRD